MMELETSPAFLREFEMKIEHTFIGDRAHIALPLMLTILIIVAATTMAFWGD